MEASLKSEMIPADEYLAGETLADSKHEFVAGHVYAIAGASEEHNIIAGNLFALLHAHLRGKPCRVFSGDMKVRLLVAGTDIFYYPDLMVAGDRRDTDRYFKRSPRVLVEVLSEATERTDRREKFLSYTQIESLEEYVLVAQDAMEVTVFRRSQQWQPEVLNRRDLPFRLPSVDFPTTLDPIYERVRI